jgi:hypothetical protein
MTRARARARGGSAPLTPSWSVNPEALPPGYVYTGGLRTQVNQDGSIGWAPHNLLWPSANFSVWASINSASSAGAGSDIAGATTARMTAGTTGTSGYYRNVGVVPNGQPFVVAAYLNRVSGSSSVQVGTDSGGRTPITVNPATGTIVSGPATCAIAPVAGGYLVWGLYLGDGATAINALCYASTAASTVIDAALWVTFGAALQPYLATTGAARFEPRTWDYSDSMEPVLGPELVVNGAISGLAGWSTSGTGTSIADAAGRMVITNGPSSEGNAVNTATTQAGKLYAVSCEVVGRTGNAPGFLVIGGTGFALSAGAPGVKTGIVLAGSTSPIRVAVGTGGPATDSITVDNVSVREVVGYAGTRRGIRIEQQATNLLLNSSAPGAGIGATNNGVTTSVVGSGTEDGLPYVDVRFVGTPTGASMSADGALFGGRIAGSANTQYCLSWYCRLLSVTQGGFSIEPMMFLVAETAAQGYLALQPTPASLRKTLSSIGDCRNSGAWTTPANTGLLRVALALGGLSVGVAIDCVVRFGGAQLEVGAVVTSYIPTSGSQVTRAADVLYWPTPNISRFDATTGTYVADLAANSQAQYVTALDGANGGVADGIVLSVRYNGARIRAHVAANGMYSNPAVESTPDAVGATKIAVSTSAAGTALAVRGRAIVRAGPNGLAPTGTNRLYLGSTRAGTEHIGGTIYRVDYYPRAANDAQFQALTD